MAKAKQPVIREDCPLRDSKYCRMLSMKDCGSCTVADTEDWEGLKRDLDVYASLLPQGGVARLFRSRTCQLCRGEEPAPRNGYAIVEMAHPQPKRIQKRSLLGKKAEPFGTMIPVQLSVCRHCRRRLLTVEYLPLILPLAVGAAGLAALSVGGLADRLSQTAAVLPFLIWLGSVLLAALAGRLAAGAAAKRYNKVMYVNVLEHPALKEMQELGWFPIARQSRTRAIFSKSRLGRGLGTAPDGPEEASGRQTDGE